MSAVSIWLDGKISRVSMRGVERQRVGAHARRHHDFLERRVAGALADAVDRALHLTRAGGDRGQRVGDRQAEIVVTVRAERRLRSAFGTRVEDRAEERADLVRDVE